MEEQKYNFVDGPSNDGKKKRKRKSSKKKVAFNVVIYSISALLLIIAAVMLFRQYFYVASIDYQIPGATPPPSGQVVAAPVKTIEPLATPAAVNESFDYVPVVFSFVGREVSCKIYPVGIKNRTMDTVDSATDLSWLSSDGYAAPGQEGNCVIAGHNSWSGKAGAFEYLKKMNPGDQVAIQCSDGYWRYFEVETKYECDYSDNTPLVGEVEGSVLTLITCKGDWDSGLGMSRTRIVVICRPVSVRGN